MNKLSALFIALCVMLTMLTGCNKYKDIEITGGKIESISMTGLRSVNLGLAVGIDNPRGKIEIRHADGVVMHFGKVIGRVTLDPFVVEKKSAGDYHLKAVFALDENTDLVLEKNGGKYLEHASGAVRFAFQCSDIPALNERLKKDGVPLSDGFERLGKTCYRGNDPDGNVFYVF